MKKLIYLCLMLVMVTSVIAQTKLSSMTRNYLMQQEDARFLNEQVSLFPIRSVANQEMIPAFVCFHDGVDTYLLESYGVIVESEFTNVATALIPATTIEALSEEPSIRYIEIAQKVYTKMNAARDLSNVSFVHYGYSPLPQAYTGRGVIVGMVDFGLQYDHINFYDNDGTLRLKRVWNQNVSGNAPEGFTTGSELTTQSEMETQRFDYRYDGTGHATHVLGIAAGSDKNNNNQYYGIATEADLAAVSFNGNDQSSTSILNGVQYLMQYADEVDKPIVINLSVGMHTGPHDGTSTFDVVCDELQGPGRLIVGAAGNEGGDQLHISKDFSPTDTVLQSFINFFYSSQRYSNIDIWGSEGTDYDVQLVVYDNATKSIVSASDTFNASTTASERIRGLSGVSGTINIATGISALNNKANTSFSISLNTLNSGYHLGLIIMADSGTVHAWTENYYSNFSSRYTNGWTMGNSNNSVGEMGGSGKRIISVGSYTSNAKSGYYQNYLDISTFSSKGPTADGRLKPDITAPGAVVVSSIPALSSVISSADIAHTNKVNGTDYYYGYMQGTSMASPYVAGSLALWLQGDPTLTPEDVRRIMDATSIRDSYTGTNLPNNTWGRGKFDAYAGPCL